MSHLYLRFRIYSYRSIEKLRNENTKKKIFLIFYIAENMRIIYPATACIFINLLVETTEVRDKLVSEKWDKL